MHVLRLVRTATRTSIRRAITHQIQLTEQHQAGAGKQSVASQVAGRSVTWHAGQLHTALGAWYTVQAGTPVQQQRLQRLTCQLGCLPPCHSSLPVHWPPGIASVPALPETQLCTLLHACNKPEAYICSDVLRVDSPT